MDNSSRDMDFNPSGVGLKNGNFIGLPFTEETANVILLPVPWDVTVSFKEGTALAVEKIREESVQHDLFDPDIKDAWKLGIFMPKSNSDLRKKRDVLREKAVHYIEFLEAGGSVLENKNMQKVLEEINIACAEMNDWVFASSQSLLEKEKLIGLVGGDHSVPLGFLQALANKYNDFGILQFDAHLDLRKKYEGFEFSHASIFYNALQLKSVSKLVQVGIRDYCEEEIEVASKERKRVEVFYNQQLKEASYNGESWEKQCERIIESLPEKVYISFDADGLDPKLCPNTGTPVPGGLEFDEVLYLIKKLVESGRKIIGFDLCETGNNDWDANVSARLLYKLSNWMGRSHGRI